MTVERPLFDCDINRVLEGVGESWRQLEGSRIFLTGGTGFFGHWLLESFLAAEQRYRMSCELVVLTRNAREFAVRAPHLLASKTVQLHEGDIRSFSFPDGRFDYVIHAAAYATKHRDEAHAAEIFENLVQGAARVASFCASAGVRRILFTSSGAVYGSQPADMPCIMEDYCGGPDPLLESAAYGEGKRAAEHILSIQANKLNVDLIVARCFAFVGPHLPLDGAYAVGNFLRDALQSVPIHVLGDGSAVRSYMYASDLAVWLWVLLLKGRTKRVYNVGSDEAIAIKDLARLVNETRGGTPSDVLYKLVPVGHSTRYVPAIDRALTELGLSVHVPLAAAIKKTLDWHRAH